MNIVCITGTRADYAIYRPLLFELHKDKDFHVQLVVTGMHLVPEYGCTIREIRKDPFPILSTPSILFKGDSTCAMSQAVGMAILYFADILQQVKPDAVLVLGDRGEMLAAAIAAHYQNVIIIHLHGGEKSGSADDTIRHTISKLAHLHFVSSKRSKSHLLQLGVEDSTIFVIGSLRKHDIHDLQMVDEQTKQDWKQKYCLTSAQKNVLLVMHPDSKDRVAYKKQIELVIQALLPIPDIYVLILGTNSDAGGNIFRRKLLQLAQQKKQCLYFPSIPPLEYLFLLSQVDLLLGNSSSGIIEAPFFQLPVINVGNRQQDREQGENVCNVPYEEDSIRRAIHYTLRQHRKKDGYNPYNVLDSPATVVASVLKTYR